MKRLSLLLFSALTLGTAAQAQTNYNKAIGVRFGSGILETFNFSYKTFVSNPGAIEFNVGLASRKHWFGIGLSATYQHHFNIVSGFSWYLGAGASVAQVISDFDYYAGTFVGLHPTLGLDLKIKEIPLNLSLDIRPTFYVARSSDFHTAYPGNLGLAVRYTF